MIEVSRSDEWLYATLNGDATLQGLLGGAGKVHEFPVPDDVVGKYVTFQVMADPEDLMVVGTSRVWVRALYRVVASQQGTSYQALKAAADRVDVLLHRKSGTTADARIVQSVRLRTYKRHEERADRQFRHLGGYYEITVQDLAA